MRGEPGQDKPAFIYRKYALAFVCVTALLFLWAIAHNFNDILIKQWI